ncbi:MAG: PUR family DNA/RNA-binding protein [Prolixibacteraceae bacterium]|nr:PUR family DNA/RNA-binding protein [Prolixibacteraceae bacterium]
MEDEKIGKESVESRFKQEIFSKAVRAGKRTYFFDVKATRNDEYYLTITESKKRFDEDGKFHFEKHKLFLYKEDFQKFMDGAKEVIDFIAEKQPIEDFEGKDEVIKDPLDEESSTTIEHAKDYTKVDFEDLDKE